jgi:hypothetical protein
MIGGTVESVTPDGERIKIVVTETTYERADYCAIRVKPSADARAVKPGEGLWWQGGFAYWTPANRSRRDVALERVGYSFDPIANARRARQI